MRLKVQAFMRFLTLLILAWISFTTLALPQTAKQLVLTHVTVIDATGAPPKQDMTLVITGNRISALGTTGKLKIPKAAQAVDARGKFLIPGLWDMHVHVFNNPSGRPPNNWYFPLFMANGVTSVREMWTKLESMKYVSEWRQEFAQGKFVGPRIAAVGTTLDGPAPKWPNTDMVATPEQARQMVRRIKVAGVDFVKVYDKLGRDEYFAIADEAKKQGLPFAGHVPFAVDAGEASDAGQRSMEHLNMLLESCSTEEEELQKAEATWNDENTKEMLDTFDGQRCRRLFTKLAANHTWQVPTLVENRRYFDADVGHVIGDPRLRYIPAEEQGTWKPYLVRQTNLTNREKYLREREWEARLNLVAEMRKAGVQFLAGTDVGNSYIFPGFSLHDELTLLVTAGLTPMEALQSATRNPAIFLGKLKEFGTIQNGKLADLVLLDANPLEDIRNTQKIRAVILNGRLFDRGELDKLLTQAEADAKKN
jgi:imidazolonepropionase-like amidohydrolase